jgi:hypothetical protein
LEYSWTGWDLVSAQGDFNGDGKSDILLRNSSTGHVMPVLMSGVNYIGALEYAWSTNTTVVSAQSDFNGDGNSDILARNETTGQVTPFIMNGVQIIDSLDYNWNVNTQFIA